MKRDKLNEAKELNAEIELLENDLELFERATKNGIDIDFKGACTHSLITWSDLYKFDLEGKADEFVNIIKQAYKNKIEELTKEFEDL